MMRSSGISTSLGLALALVLSAPGVMAAGEHEGGHGEEQGARNQEERGQGQDNHGQKGDGQDGHHNGGDGHEHGHGHGADRRFAFGEPAPEAAPDRVVEIVAHDTMRFEPSEVTVRSGEVVRFVIRNPGQLQHSFTLGSPQYQRTHEREMRGMAHDRMATHMDDAPHGLVVQPGEEATLTWRFERGGPVQFACHIPGHYDAGMKGRIRWQD